MGFRQTIKALFGRPQQPNQVPAEQGQVAAHTSGTRLEIDVEAGILKNKYGADFYSFLYRPDTDLFIRKEVLSFRDPDNKFNRNFLDNDNWTKKHWFNFPGPFYTGESDTCGTGPIEAPNNVLLDADCLEFIFKQPRSFSEFLSVLDAAGVEVFDSYSCNGNTYWTYQKCRDWWKNKNQLLHELKTPEFIDRNGQDANLYIDYLNSNAENDLRKYCYFLETGAYPGNDDLKLPTL